MTPLRQTRRFSIALLVIALLVVGTVAALSLTSGYTADQTLTREFTLDEPFEVVARVLRQRGVATEILNRAGSSEFVDEQWDDTDVGFRGFSLDATGPKLDLSVTRTGTLRVRTLNREIGEHVITLDRRVELDANHAESRVTLREGTDQLVGYELVTRFERSDGAGVLGGESATAVVLSLREVVKTRAPFFFAHVADSRLHDSAAAALEGHERAIREVIGERSDELAAERDAAEASGKAPGALQQLLRGLLDR